MNAKNFWTESQYNADWTVHDQIAAEYEIEKQMEAAYEEDCYERELAAWQQDSIRFDRRLDAKGVWRIHAVEGVNPVRLNVVVPGYTSQEVVRQMVESGRFDKLVPDWIEKPYRFWIEKW